MDKNIKQIIEQESNDRNDILEELEKNMFAHNNKIREFENKVKNLDILKMKYNNLQREYNDLNKKYEEKSTLVHEQIENLQTEIQVLRKTILGYKSKVTSLQSIIALLVDDFGIDQVALASGISTDKIKEYLEDKI